ncbi:chloride channel protein [Fibrobacter sp. UWEL]|uniref:chloride channel protein n=1 Tax=Fibrobacter sp. UWEL TaxID=1896209 RepID=UPI0009134770|nr:chloride channel protein [Fibrobacter sp. UWEL]SHK44613.1 chloride channel protein, CIC family [Fibrobacter sp. UWEL]
MSQFIKRFNRFLVVNGYMPKIFLAAVIGFVTGLVAVAFHFGLGLATSLVKMPWTGENALPWWTFAIMPAIGGLIVGVIIYVIAKAPETAGQGTDNMIKSFHHEGGKIRKRVAPVKFLTSIITLATGGSAGYEGPISQIGSGVASTLCHGFKMPQSLRRQFTLAGTAAGLGSIFKAPLAGALTSVEVLYREDFESNAFATSIVSSVVAFTVYIAFVGTEPAIAGVPVFPFANAVELGCCAVLGILCFPFSYLYVRCYSESENRFARWQVPNWIKPAIGGLMISVLVLAYPEVAGGGFEFIGEVMGAMMPHTIWGVLLLLAIVLAKIVATGLTVGSGGSGGVFGPSLFIGGVLGAAFAGVCELVAPGVIRSPEMFILVGMAAFFAGAAKAPIAGVVMVCEMTGSYSLLPGLLIAAVMHIAFSRPWSIYKSQVLNKFASPAHRGDMDVDVLKVTTVGDVIEHCEMKTLRGEDSLSDVLKDIEVDYVYPVYEGTSRTPAGLSLGHEHTGTYIGLLDMSIVKNAYISSPDLIQHLLISDCTVRAPMLLDTMDLHSALRIFVRTSLQELCVKNKNGEVIGVLSHGAIFKAYDKIVQQKAS